MLLIVKGSEPRSLTWYRQQAFADYDGCNKDDIRRSLFIEQGGLCAYCMRRVKAAKMKIEHWYPRAELMTDAEKLDYSNMLGVCSGHDEKLGEGEKYDTCDAKKKDAIITVDPRKIEHIQKIAYRTASGEIYSEDVTIDHDLNDALNLNCRERWLPQNRKAALDIAIQTLNDLRKRGTWTKTMLNRMKERYETGNQFGEKAEYAGIVIWYLEKHLRQTR